MGLILNCGSKSMKIIANDAQVLAISHLHKPHTSEDGEVGQKHPSEDGMHENKFVEEGRMR